MIAKIPALLLLLLTARLGAQSLPDAPQPVTIAETAHAAGIQPVKRPRLDRWEWGMLAGDLVVRQLDTWSTRKALTAPCRFVNSNTERCFREQQNFGFIVHNTAMLTTYDAAVPVFYGFIAWKLEKHHHPRWAHFVAGFDLVYDGTDVVRNLTWNMP